MSGNPGLPGRAGGSGPKGNDGRDGSSGRPGPPGNVAFFRSVCCQCHSLRPDCHLYFDNSITV